MDKFEINKDIIQLNQLVKAMGWCESGSMANSLIDEGYVKVNGKVEYRRRNKLGKGIIVEFDGNKVELV
jgi:ribosome-associated protein